MLKTLQIFNIWRMATEEQLRKLECPVCHLVKGGTHIYVCNQGHEVIDAFI